MGVAKENFIIFCTWDIGIINFAIFSIIKIGWLSIMDKVTKYEVNVWNTLKLLCYLSFKHTIPLNTNQKLTSIIKVVNNYKKMYNILKHL